MRDRTPVAIGLTSTQVCELKLEGERMVTAMPYTLHKYL